MPGQPRWEKDDPILAAQLNAHSEGTEKGNSRDGDGKNVTVQETPAAQILGTDARLKPFWATLSGAGPAYSWTGAYLTSSGTWSATSRTGTSNAHEANGRTGLSGQRARLRPDGRGGYVFYAKRCCTTCTGTVTVNVKCNGTNVASATVTISQGGTTYATGSTNGSGNFSTTALPASGTYDIVVSKSGFNTYTGTFSYSCANITVNVVLSSSSNVVAGRVTGCGSDLVGASITVTQGVSTLGTGTTDGSGNYSITLSGWSSGAVTVTASKTRYANGSTSTTPSSCGTTTTPSTIVLSPATDYYCDPCGGTVPVYKTIYLTQPWDGATVTLTSGGGSSWSGTGTWTGTGYTDCGSATTSTITITVNWSLNADCSVTLRWNGCAAPFSSRNPISDAYAASNPGSVSTSTVFNLSPTHTNSPFSVSASLTGYMGGGSGTATITE